MFSTSIKNKSPPALTICHWSLIIRVGSLHGWKPSGFINVSRGLQNILSKCVHCRNRTSFENFKLKLSACAKSHALGTRTKFQLEIVTLNEISGIVYFRENFLESSRNDCETTSGSREYLSLTLVIADSGNGLSACPYLWWLILNCALRNKIQ